MKIDKSAYGEDYNKELNDKIVKIASVAVCLVIIFVIGILAWALPQPTYSEYEKRDLNQMPEFSLESLLNHIKQHWKSILHHRCQAPVCGMNL